jgi:hypothetical protein
VDVGQAATCESEPSKVTVFDGVKRVAVFAVLFSLGGTGATSEVLFQGKLKAILGLAMAGGITGGIWLLNRLKPRDFQDTDTE